MRFLTILALFILPMTFAQTYSTDSYALTGKTTQQEILFDKTPLPNGHGSNIRVYVDKEIHSKKSSETQAENEQAKINIAPPLKTKKIRLVEGTRNSKGMQLLSFLLLLKDKNK
jgi:hypothetical protein